MLHPLPVAKENILYIYYSFTGNLGSTSNWTLKISLINSKSLEQDKVRI